MKNLENITTVFSVMKGLNVSLDDLVAYANNHTETENLASPEQEPSSRTKLPLEVLYENNYRSFFVEKDKNPIAIIVGDFGVAFEDAPEAMSWHDAEKYCEKYSLGGKNWQLPNKGSGHLKALYENKEAINKVLIAFGKEPLKKSWYWSSSDYSNYGAWTIRFSDGRVTNNIYKYSNYYVRPITFL